MYGYIFISRGYSLKKWGTTNHKKCLVCNKRINKNDIVIGFFGGSLKTIRNYKEHSHSQVGFWDTPENYCKSFIHSSHLKDDEVKRITDKNTIEVL
jgi:hypothetical protein